MPITRLDHVNLRTSQLEAMIAWYEDVLGLENGARPDFGFPGAWLYAGEFAIVHLVDASGDAGAGSEAALKLEHFAMRATDAAGFEVRLTARGEDYKRSTIDALGLVAFNIWDPDGNHIHVDFTDG
ncbi:VOC family protein [uncultured Tateyamaria sp.]|uniref:VOC family protein n=1 Tax=uncultured Tateyamaria sp. TaxID=455651 RepID=UPI00262BEC46|nr:VOC family protein [uncultured Tateyamaria sp.]